LVPDLSSFYIALLLTNIVRYDSFKNINFRSLANIDENITNESAMSLKHSALI